MKANFIDIEGTRTRYLSAGSGQCVLLVHGFGVGAETWCRNIDVLSEHFHVIAPDLLGQGFTDPVDLGDDPPHPHIIEHLTRFVETMALERINLVGSSFGALISSLLWFQMPERIERLVLVGTGSVFNADDNVPKMVEGAIANSSRVLENPTLDGLRQRLSRLFFNPDHVPDEILLCQLTSLALPGVVDFWKKGVRGMLDNKARPYRVLDRLEKITVPTLVIWGREDPRGEHEAAVSNLHRFPDASMVTFDNCGHFPYMEMPEKFNSLVEQYLTSGDITYNQ